MTIRLRLRCRGAVQGVGFRPTVHRLATAAGLGGRVWNDPGGATIEIEGTAEAVRTFARNLPHRLPPLARLDDLETSEIPIAGETAFIVVSSQSGRPAGATVPPDAALCRACLDELRDASDRRFEHPFITCTDCGPRYSLVRSLPYDRPRTSMGCFPLCARCEAQYTDPTDRRFHAEPVCCPDCGPRLWLADAHGREIATGRRAVEEAAAMLREGGILAVKGLGGFQLACRADLEPTVEQLRRRKNRPGKPFAVMTGTLDDARSLVTLSSDDERLIASARCPIVLGPRRSDAQVADGVAPGMEDLGVLLPTTPVHHLLFRRLDCRTLVMTSGNASDEPICKGNREALERLRDIADAFLLHDRDVVRRVDDSVARSSPSGPFLIRRARGWVPEPLDLPVSSPEALAAVGAHLQVTAAVAQDRSAVLTPHVGDLDTDEARAFLREALRHLEDLLEIEAGWIVADAHPDYPSRWFAEELARRRHGRLLEVQHHLAHGAAVLAEHGRFPEPRESALVLALDGTGWGPDRTAWGGEWLVMRGDLRWMRAGHLEPLPLIGGEAAVHEPWRIAVAALARSGRQDLLTAGPLAAALGAGRLQQMAGLSNGDDWPRATGAGRLFEACGALLGLAPVNTFEGEAAIRLEAAAAGCPGVDPWDAVRLSEGSTTLPSTDLLTAAARRLAEGETTGRVAAGFHATFCSLASEITREVLRRHGPIESVAAGGGCLVNRLVRNGLSAGPGHPMLLPVAVPPGDGGLAYGQAVLASVCLARSADPDRLKHPVAIAGRRTQRPSGIRQPGQIRISGQAL